MIFVGVRVLYGAACRNFMSYEAAFYCPDIRYDTISQRESLYMCVLRLANAQLWLSLEAGRL